MADGSAKPLDHVKVGDKVTATNPATGRTRSRTVTKVWVNHDTDLLDVTVRSGGTTSVIHATQHHLFWDDTNRAWVEAGHLQPGDRLRTDNGRAALVAAVAVVPGVADMWDLTVLADHDFYVMAAATGNVVTGAQRYDRSDTVDNDHTYNVHTVGTGLLVHNQDCSDAAWQGALHIQEEYAAGNLSHTIPGIDMSNTRAIAAYLDRVMAGPAYTLPGGERAWYDGERGLAVISRTDYSATAYEMSYRNFLNLLSGEK